jgi:hypothetical protein
VSVVDDDDRAKEVLQVGHALPRDSHLVMECYCIIQERLPLLPLPGVLALKQRQDVMDVSTVLEQFGNR